MSNYYALKRCDMYGDWSQIAIFHGKYESIVEFLSKEGRAPDGFLYRLHSIGVIEVDDAE